MAKRAGRAYGRTIDAWLECGRHLLRAREVAEHGDWLPFLESAGISERTAQRMLLVAERGLKSDTVTVLGGVGAAVDFVVLTNRAMANWRHGLAECERDCQDWHLVMQAVPDGPFSTSV